MAAWIIACAFFAAPFDDAVDALRPANAPAVTTDAGNPFATLVKIDATAEWQILRPVPRPVADVRPDRLRETHIAMSEPYYGYRGYGEYYAERDLNVETVSVPKPYTMRGHWLAHEYDDRSFVAEPYGESVLTTWFIPPDEFAPRLVMTTLKKQWPVFKTPFGGADWLKIEPVPLEPPRRWHGFGGALW
jgi:hypothetical protein